jgi:diguanylate cyclase
MMFRIESPVKHRSVSIDIVDVMVEPLSTMKLSQRAARRRPSYVAQAVSYQISAVILTIYSCAGTIPISVPIVYLVCGTLATAIALTLSETNLNDRFRDHYLTVPQTIVNMTIQLGAIYLAPEVGFYFIFILFVVLSFGALPMSARGAAFVWTYATVGLSALLLLTDKAIAMPITTWTERTLLLACAVTALGRCASTGLYGSSIRAALYQRGNELKKAHARIEELAQVDELTGLLNRRYIMKSLNEEMARAQRTGATCSVAIIDIDFFKRINDQCGHLVGDDVLRTFAATLLANIRSMDKLGRYGGEEFLLILPDSANDQAVLTLDRLRSIASEVDWGAISSITNVTMSAGLCSVRQEDSAADILARADVALYRAKDAGRNQVIAA